MTIRQPGFPDRVVALHEGGTRLGRSEDNEVVLSDVGVSRRHAQVYWSGSECLIEDLGSGNGTYLRGQRIQSQPLADGDEVVVDPFVLTFRIRGSTPAPAPAPETSGPRLEVIVGTGMAGASYAITSRGLGIGRAEDRDVVLPDPAASRHHCQITAMGDRYVLKDLGSANGVYLNGVRVREQSLEDGDVIRIGNTEMRFVRTSSVGTDLTTQVTSALGPLPAGQGYTGHAVIPTSPPQPAYAPPARSGGGGSAIVLWLTVFATLVGMVVLLGLGSLGALYYFAYESPPPLLEARAPAWKLKLPGGLEGGGTDELFNAGVDKMKQRDYRGALLDFYRVLEADPSSRVSQKFALVAGEVVVLDHLGGWLTAEARARKEQSARRDGLITKAKRGGKLGKIAEATLTEEFREDPVAIREMGWPPTPEMTARAAARTRAAELLAAEQYLEAATDYEVVLAGSLDREERIQALAGVKTCRRELARAVAADWREGEMTGAQRDAAASAAAFERVKQVDPSNVCARLQPR